MKDEITRIATAAALRGHGILIIGARQNFMGHVARVGKDFVLLSHACVAFDTGPLRDEKIATQQSPPGGQILVPFGAIDAVMEGKAAPKDADDELERVP